MFENTFTYKTTLKVLEMLSHGKILAHNIYGSIWEIPSNSNLFRAVVKTTTKSARKNAWWSCSRSRVPVCNSAKPRYGSHVKLHSAD